MGLGKRLCSWLKASGGLCNNPTDRGSDYCYTHGPLASIGYERKGKKSKSQDPDQLRTKWLNELDRDLERSQELREERRHKHTQRHWKPNDFPCKVDGLWFETIDEFYLFYAGQDFEELAGTDQEYLTDEILPPAPRQSSLYFPQYSRDPHFQGSQRSLSYYTPPKPKVTLEKGSWRKIHAIMHMRYCVARTKDGSYHAVWVSLNAGGETEQVMGAALALPMPCFVTETEQGRYHTSRAFYSYESALDMFYKGGETFSRIEERIKKVQDPQWIPPNLRALAIKNQFDLIPEPWKPRLKKWVMDGCKGWYGAKKSLITLFDTKPKQ